MAEYIQPEEWQLAIQAMGPEGAEEWRRNFDIQVADPNGELPVVGSTSGDLGIQPNFNLGGDGALPMADRGLSGLYGELGQAQERSRTSRLQLLQEATQALQQRRMGPDTAEKLYAISAALFAPTRTKGFSGMMGNLMPLAQQMRRTGREGEQTRQDALLSLRQKYQAAESESDVDAIRNKINLYKASRTGSGMHVTSDPYGRRFNTRTGFDVPGPAHIQALIQNPVMASDFDIKFGPGASAQVLAQYGSQ